MEIFVRNLYFRRHSLLQCNVTFVILYIFSRHFLVKRNVMWNILVVDPLLLVKHDILLNILLVPFNFYTAK